MHISSLTFIGCNQNHVIATEKFTLQHCVGLDRDSLDLQTEGTAIIASRSGVHILNSSFSNFIGSQWELHRITAQKYINLSYTQAGGAIICSNCNIWISNSVFQGNTAQLGGAIYAEVKSNITILNSRFLDHNVSCQRQKCFGGVIFSDTSNLQVSYCNFSSNTNIHSDPPRAVSYTHLTLPTIYSV